MLPRFDFLAIKAGIFGAPYITLGWPSPWHDHCCEIKQRWGAMHGRLCSLECLFLLTWGDTVWCDAGTRCAMRVSLKITMWTPCSRSTTAAFRWLSKNGQCHLFPQICGWRAAWSLSNRSTPTICMHPFFFLDSKHPALSYFPCQSYSSTLQIEKYKLKNTIFPYGNIGTIKGFGISLCRHFFAIHT